jgi:hypothetical protein
MAWAVDTCLLIDVAEADPTFGVPSAKLLDQTPGSPHHLSSYLG